MQRADHRIRAADGRLLLACTAGPSKGDPVFVLHGTPGVRQLYQPDIEEGARRGLRYVSYSRPGYGGSDPLPGRLIADCASDIRAIADHLGIRRFYVIGESGGGPHALATAASLPDRVRAVALIAAVAPTYALGADWIKGMGKGNIKELEAARKGPHKLKKFLENEILGIQKIKTVAELCAVQSEHLCEADVLVSQGDFGAFQLAAWKQIAKEGPSGWFNDDLALYGHWGFELDGIAAPVTVWQGHEDLIVPLGHGRWFAQVLPNADFRSLPGEGHISLGVNHYGAVLDALIASAQ